MNKAPTNSRQSLAQARRDETDWAVLDTAERIRRIELDGYVVIPGLLSPEQLETIRAEVDRLPTTPTDYSEHQRGHLEPQFSDCPGATEVIGHPGMLRFLEALFGDEIICTSCTFALSQPGHPGIAIHTDAQPYGSEIFGMQASSPCLVRALYYLDDLTPLRSPLKVIPRSHLSMHVDANPYNRCLNHPDEVMVTCQAGDAALINQRVFHGNYPNYSQEDRRMLAIAYRPAWAGPVGEVPERDLERVAALPPAVRRLFASLNTRRIDFHVPNRPDNLDRPLPGIGRQRWRQEASPVDATKE